MNDEIRKIVGGYINEGDYEKALSLLMNLPLENDADKELLESCKKGFAASCSSSITEAVNEKNRAVAEKILQSYKKLIGEDSNSLLYQTLINSIPAESQPVAQTKEKGFVNFTDFSNACVPAMNFEKSKITWISYLWLAFVMVVCGCTCEPSSSLCVASVVLSAALAFPVISCKNNMFKAVALALLLAPVISTISLYSAGLGHISGGLTKLAFPTLPWLMSFIWVIVFCFINTDKSLKFKIISSLLLFTVLNPIWYGMIVPGGVETYKEGSDSLYTSIRFAAEAGFMITLSTLVTLCIYYFSIARKLNLFRSFLKARRWILQNKRKITIALGVVAGLFIIICVIGAVVGAHNRNVAQRAAIEKARQDSIQSVEKARIAAIEKARQDSIARVQRAEQARRDSIDYAEHAGFVKKYANIGLIITKLRMSRGQNSNGVATKGIEYEIFNPTHKTIKYVIANVQAVNKFNDPISYNYRCRGIGPIDSHDFGSWDFNDAFEDKNDVIDDLSVSFQVVYTNGSSKTIRWKDAYVSDFKTSWFNGR